MSELKNNIPSKEIVYKLPNYNLITECYKKTPGRLDVTSLPKEEQIQYITLREVLESFYKLKDYLGQLKTDINNVKTDLSEIRKEFETLKIATPPLIEEEAEEIVYEETSEQIEEKLLIGSKGKGIQEDDNREIRKD